MKNPKNILITGGSGLIGSRLTEMLREHHYAVSHLGRSSGKQDIRTFIWNPAKGEVESGALNNVDVIVHLAGAGIADKRWNQRRKQEILLSRTASTRLLQKTLAKGEHRVRTFISASGISYYGLKSGERPFDEASPPAMDFMAQVAVAWEKEADQIALQGVRVAKIRTGVVLSPTGGALEKLVTPVKYLVGAPLGSGNQFVNWIHIDDLCRLYMRVIEDASMEGSYNAVAPYPVTNRELTREIARALNRPLLLPPVPGFVVKLIAGDVAEVVLEGGKISSEKVQRIGFKFLFPTIREALADLLPKEEQSSRAT